MHPQTNDLSVKDRLLSKIKVDGDGCWWWQGAIHKPGYGRISVNGKLMGAHRASYAVFVGPIPVGFDVCHHCDNRACINPKHLFAGPRSANIADAKAKGRLARGERHGQAKLTDDDVVSIRQLSVSGVSGRELGRRFGVNESTISSALNRHTWIHV